MPRTWFAFKVDTRSLCPNSPLLSKPVCGHANMCTCMHICMCDPVFSVCLFACVCSRTLVWLFISVEMASAGSSYSQEGLGWLTDHICFQRKQKQCRSNPKTTGTWWLRFNVIIPLRSACMRGPSACFSTLCLFQCVQERRCLTLEASFQNYSTTTDCGCFLLWNECVLH